MSDIIKLPGKIGVDQIESNKVIITLTLNTTKSNDTSMLYCYDADYTPAQIVDFFEKGRDCYFKIQNTTTTSGGNPGEYYSNWVPYSNYFEQLFKITIAYYDDPYYEIIAPGDTMDYGDQLMISDISYGTNGYYINFANDCIENILNLAIQDATNGNCLHIGELIDNIPESYMKYNETVDSGFRGERDLRLVDYDTTKIYYPNESRAEQTFIQNDIKNSQLNYLTIDNQNNYDIIGQGTVNYPSYITQTDQFLYRKTADGLDFIPGKDAYVTKVKGNTVAWNHLIESINYTSGVTQNGITIQGNGVYKISGTSTNGVFLGITNKGVTFIGGHKYYFGGLRGGSENSYRLWVGSSYAFPPGSRLFVGEKPMIGTASNTESIQSRAFYFQVTRAGITVDTTISPTLFDLTLIYGVGNEPTTPEQFEADYLSWFGKPLSYEEYDAGSLRPVLMNGIKTIGFNQWDEEWVNGYVVKETGNVIQNSSTTIASKNLIPVVSNATYYFKGNGYITLYDANQAVIGQVQKNNTTFDIGANVRYIRFHIDNYGTTYNHNICINFSDTSRNGTYEPYKETIAQLPIISLTGKLNGSGNSVKVFPDGLKKVGDIYDEIYVENGVTKAIKRVGSVDLGTLTWTKSSSHNYFFTDNITDFLKPANDNSIANIICAKYQTLDAVSTTSDLIFQNIAAGASALHRVFINEPSFNDASSLQSALNGVMLYYELAEPLEYEIDWNPLCHARYSAEKGGTEEVQIYNNVSSNPTLTIEYGHNFDYLQTPIIRSGSHSNTLLVESSNAIGYDTITLNDPYIRGGYHGRDVLIESSNNAMGYNIVSLPEVPYKDSGLLKREDYNTFKDSIHFEENIKNNSGQSDYPGCFIESSVRRYYVNAEILSVKSAVVDQTRPFMGTTSYLSDVADQLEIIFPDRTPNSELISTFTCIFKTGTNCNITLTSNYSIRFQDTSFSFSDNCIYELNARYIDSNIGWLVAIGKWS